MGRAFATKGKRKSKQRGEGVMALFKRKPKAEKAAGEKQGQMKVLKDAFALTRKHQPVAFLLIAIYLI